MIVCWLSIISFTLEVNGSNSLANNFFPNLRGDKPYITLPLYACRLCSKTFFLYIYLEFKGLMILKGNYKIEKN